MSTATLEKTQAVTGTFVNVPPSYPTVNNANVAEDGDDEESDDEESNDDELGDGDEELDDSEE